LKKKEKRIKKILWLLTRLNEIFSSSSVEKNILDSICSELVNSGLYKQALIIRAKDGNSCTGFSFSGEMKDPETLEKEFGKGVLPPCLLNNKFENSYFLAAPPDNGCKSCFFPEYDSFCVWTELKLHVKRYGYLCVRIDRQVIDPNSFYEFDFLVKIGIDISQGIRNLDAAKERNAHLNEIIEYSRELQAIYENIPMVMAVADRNRNIVKINSYAEKIYKIKEDRAKNLALGELLCCSHRFEDDSGCGLGRYCTDCVINKAVKKTLETNKPCSQMEGVLESENDVKNVLVSTTPLNYSLNELVLVLIDDITSLKKAQKESEEKKDSLTQLVENMKSGVAVYEYDENEKDFIIIDFNTAAQNLEKVEKESVLGKGVKKVFPGVVPTGLFDCFLKVYSTGVPRRFPVIFYLDSRISGWRENYVYRLENKNIVAVYDDVTEQKIAEEKIKEQKAVLEKREKEYREIFNNSPVGIFRTTIDGRPLNINPAMAKILGCENVEETLEKYAELSKDLYVDPDRRKEFIKLLEVNKKVENFVYKGKTADNRYVWIKMSASVTQGDNEKYIEGFAKDITKEYKALSDLKVSEEKFSKIFMLGSALISISDMKSGEYIDVNPSFLRATGYSKDELIGFKGSEIGIITKETRDRLYSAINEKGKIKDFEIEFFNKKGERFYGLYSGDIILLDGKTSLLSTVFDITERKVYQQEAIRAGQLAQTGELAAGVAHEINNPINGIINYAQILSDEFEFEGRDKEIPLRIIREGERISKIAGALLNFSGSHRESFASLDLYDVLKETLFLAEVQIKKDGITLINDFPQNLCRIKGKARELEQVFFNVFLNSRYALNEKYPFPSKEKILKITGKQFKKGTRNFVKIEFFDSGTGIQPEIMGKIKSPFFTTKPKGKGTGLGLSLSSSIIERHFGNIEIKSVFREYTRVEIELPEIDEFQDRRDFS
jgi:PAS domain S-box-containing protein